MFGRQTFHVKSVGKTDITYRVNLNGVCKTDIVGIWSVNKIDI